MDALGELDVIVVGAGVNGLVCATVLARAGLRVHVVEDGAVVGGTFRTELPFAKAPRLAAGIGAHRLGFVPGDLVRLLGLSLKLRPRDPCTFVPTATPGGFLLASPGHAAFRDAVASSSLAGPRDATALAAMHAELDEIVADLTPAWVSAALGVEETAERYVRASRRDALVALCRGSAGAYVERFGVESDLVKAALASDALASSFASWDTPGTGAALLVRHASQSGVGGADAIPEGGIGAVVTLLAETAQAAGVTIATGTSATQIVVEGNAAAGVMLASGEELRATTVVSSADPSRLRALIGDARLPTEYQRRVDGFVRGGSVAKVNLVLSELPRFAALPDDRGQHGAVIRLVPRAGEGAIEAMKAAFAQAQEGFLPKAPSIEMVLSSGDGAGADGRHHASLLVPMAPYDLAGTTWAAEESTFAKSVLDVIDAFAPGTSGSVVEVLVLSPKKLESHFGVTRGQLHHVDDAVIFGDRLAFTTPIGGVYACGAGCAPAGGVFAAAGHNAAKRVLADMELGLERTEVGSKF